MKFFVTATNEEFDGNIPNSSKHVLANIYNEGLTHTVWTIELETIDDLTQLVEQCGSSVIFHKEIAGEIWYLEDTAEYESFKDLRWIEIYAGYRE